MSYSPLHYQSDRYFKTIEIMGGVKFTRREIDILACLLSGKSVGVIAGLLDISSRTLEAHLSNIRGKLNVNSRNGIIEFLEKLDKLPMLKDHYQYLLLESGFRGILKKVSKLIPKKACIKIVYNKADEELTASIETLTQYLHLAGCKTLLDKQEKDFLLSAALPKNIDSIIYIWDKKILEKVDLEGSFPASGHADNPIPIIFLSFNEKLPMPTIAGVEYVNFNSEGGFYDSLLLLLQKIIPTISFGEFVEEFHRLSKTIKGPSEGVNTSVDAQMPPAVHSGFLKRHMKHMVIANCLFFIGLIAWLLIGGHQKDTERLSSQSIRADLIVPTESVMLKRPDLIQKIEEKLSIQKGIKTVVLVGMGGVGKTTIARQFGQLSDAPVVWEVNAETKESLINSLRDLAYVLANTKRDEEELGLIRSLQNSEEKEKRLLTFLKGHLKNYPNWLLIYDNVEEFSDIKNYFPQDYKIWGNGQVIITTRDSNIHNTSYINSKSIIPLEELSQSKCLALFSKIFCNSGHKDLSSAEKEKALDFLKHIPSFPLDISVAAYYIKDTHMSYNRYLEEINQSSKSLDITQTKFLKEISSYDRTRYGIVSLSFKKLMRDNPAYRDLLSFLCVLDSQRVPRSLLEFYKGKALVDSFIHDIRKYSFITGESVGKESDPEDTFSIHRSVKVLGLHYLNEELKLQKDITLLKSIAKTLGAYLENTISKGDFLKIRASMSHIEQFLLYIESSSIFSTNDLRSTLGEGYVALRDYKKAEEHLRLAILNLKKEEPQNYKGIINTLAYLGINYCEMGDYKKAKIVADDCLFSYKKYLERNNVDVAKVCSSLAEIYVNLGDYKSAKNLLEKSLEIYRAHPNNYSQILTQSLLGNLHANIGNYKEATYLLEQGCTLQEKFSGENIDLAWILTCLGETYRSTGDYKKAIFTLEKAARIYTKNLGEKHLDTAWSMNYLGKAYISMGDYNKASALLQNCLLIYKNHLGENNIRVIGVLKNILSLYAHLGDYKQAKDIKEKVLIETENHYGPNHIRTASILLDLSKIYQGEKRIQLAEETIKKAMKIFKDNHHSGIYMALESLSDLYISKNYTEKNIPNKQAALLLREALEIIKDRFPENSIHIIRIQSKLKSLET